MGVVNPGSPISAKTVCPLPGNTPAVFTRKNQDGLAQENLTVALQLFWACDPLYYLVPLFRPSWSGFINLLWARVKAIFHERPRSES